MFVIDLDEEFMETLLCELTLWGDGKFAHEIAMNSETKIEAAKEFLLRLEPFFSENFYERNAME